ncbi:hypothetical protein Avbf_13786 [Armadillidium vulgare]|nr:hypothetical protein Avbf_13786 [Armadillidium vulgare]
MDSWSHIIFLVEDSQNFFRFKELKYKEFKMNKLYYSAFSFLNRYPSHFDYSNITKALLNQYPKLNAEKVDYPEFCK